jgi:hypothetical protein
LAAEKPVMDVEDVRAIIHSLEVVIKPKEEPEAEPKVVPHYQVAQSVDDKFNQAISPLQKKLNFNRRQWILLSAFVVVDVVVLVLILLYVVFTA